jgi:hypothetical protein
MRVEKLGFHIAIADSARFVQQAIGQGRFTVIDMRNDAKVANSGDRYVSHELGHPIGSSLHLS